MFELQRLFRERDSVLDCGSPLPLCLGTATLCLTCDRKRYVESGRGLPQSKTLARRMGRGAGNRDYGAGKLKRGQPPAAIHVRPRWGPGGQWRASVLECGGPPPLFHRTSESGHRGESARGLAQSKTWRMREASWTPAAPCRFGQAGQQRLHPVCPALARRPETQSAGGLSTTGAACLPFLVSLPVHSQTDYRSATGWKYG